MAFHHGTKTTRVAGGSVAVETVDGAIIGIVGLHLSAQSMN